MIPAKGCIKNYHWGRVGNESHIARFQEMAPKCPKHPSNGASESENDNKLPLAELWFGSHPSGPASLAIGNHLIKLNEFLQKEPEMVGVVEKYFKFNKQLPFLFKILAVSQPLSLQAHPNKNLAEKLHKKDPRNYPDANHKPELAIALTDFHVLCDFKPHKEIVDFIRKYTQLKRIVGEQNYQNYSQSYQRARSTSDSSTDSASASASSISSHNQDIVSDQLRVSLSDCFKSLMTCSKETIIQETKSLLEESSDKIAKDLKSLIVELSDLYPGDPGIFAPFFMNYIKLSPGEAVFMRAHKLHAYLKGECIECMACSDNVVRAGLTTKFRDVDTLISMLDYEPVKNVQDVILSPKDITIDNISIVSYPIQSDEFKVEKISVSHRVEYTLEAKLSGSFVIVLNGKAKTKDFFDMKQEHKMSFGFAGFIPPKIEAKLHCIQGTLVMYRAFC